ncbi:UNVERIFIED_CONTAM: Retrovirus-related Pol polyprotein from transposon TNT 1-94 [Sesamum angustifolium]|uniref:RING-type E3 ubiquitin transferase n=1 Tax=Sesamum angustifolium TaxID=2727405 RepID=A0AAW2LGQ1_9LAMI
MVCTRPDIAYSISCLSRYMSNAGLPHWEALKWLLRYLNGSANRGLIFKCAKGVDLTGYVDSNYANDRDSRSNPLKNGDDDKTLTLSLDRVSSILGSLWASRLTVSRSPASPCTTCSYFRFIQSFKSSCISHAVNEGNHRWRVVHLHRVIYNLPSPAGTERRLRHVPTPARRDRGLSEELILKNLRTRSCRAEVGDEEERGICVMCQDDMRPGNHAIGVLDCGHDYHACCVTRWLREKNICPLCKAIALHVDDDRCGLLV